MNSDLTREIQSSINDMCQCTLPSYTLRGSVDLCDLQSNCAIYTGRLLGSNEASTNQVFEMVQDWLDSQNGSVLNGRLSVDPNCPLRRLSPSDMVCSFSDNTITSDNPTEQVNPSEESQSSSDRQAIEVIEMLAIGFGSGFGIIICAVIVCVCVYKSRKIKRKKSTISLTYSESEARLTPFLQPSDPQRHYSVVVERNPSYHCHRSNFIKPIMSNGRQLEESSSDTLSSENPYSYTSLKSAQRQADALMISQQKEGIAHLTVEQLQRHASDSSNNEYVVGSLTSSDYYSNEENGTSTFYPPSTPNNRGTYLSVS